MTDRSRTRPDQPASRRSPPSGRGARRNIALDTVRYALPAAVVAAGLIVMAFGSETDLEGGAGIVGAGLAIYFLNWLYRIGVAGERQRDDEDAARDHFARHGRWPS